MAYVVPEKFAKSLIVGFQPWENHPHPRLGRALGRCTTIGMWLPHDMIEHLPTRPVCRPPGKPIVVYHSFRYQAASWETARRVVAKIEWHAGELFPGKGFIVTNLRWKSSNVVKFYNKRDTAEQ